MPVSESILVAVFCMAVVFAVLIMLWAIIRVFSYLIHSLEKGNKTKAVNTDL